MTPAQAIAMLDRQLAAHGEDVVVRRYTAPTGTPRPKTDVEGIRAFVRAVKSEDLVGDIKQTHSAVVLSPTGLTSVLPLVNGDKVVIDGRERNVDLVKPIKIGNRLVRMNLMVAG